VTDYTKATNFSSKDDLPAGADDKVILGSEWDTELAAIVTAIASKYDSADLSDQSTAEAGVSNAVLMRTMQRALALSGKLVGLLAITSRAQDGYSAASDQLPTGGTYEDLDGLTFSAVAGGLYFVCGMMRVFSSSGLDPTIKVTSTGTLSNVAVLLGRNTLDTAPAAIVAADSGVSIDATSSADFVFVGYVKATTAGTVSFQATASATILTSLRKLFALRVA
jgi:hypothetical protein